MKNREFDIIFTFYGNDEGTIYGLVYKNTDCFLPINEYCWETKKYKAIYCGYYVKPSG